MIEPTEARGRLVGRGGMMFYSKGVGSGCKFSVKAQG